MIEVPEGTIAVFDVNTQRFQPRPGKEPDENQELWRFTDGEWEPYREETPEEIKSNIHALLLDAVGSIEAAMEKVDQL